MKVNQKLLLSLFALLLLFVSSACIHMEKSAIDSNNAENKEKTRMHSNINKIRILTGGTQGTYYPLGKTFAKFIDQETGIPTAALVSQASAANAHALQEKMAEIAFIQTDIAFYATEALFMFENNKIDNIAALGTLYPETVQLVTTEGSGITSYEDLKGKRVSVGALESGVYANAEQLLEVHDLSMSDIKAQRLDFADSIEGLKQGQIDAAFITAGTPTAAVEDLNKTANIIIVGISEKMTERLVDKYPYYAKDVIKKGTYGIKKDVNTVSVSAMLVVRKDLPEDLVYQMTKTIYSHANEIQHPKGKYINVNNALDGIGIEVHPGALKYYNEID